MPTQAPDFERLERQLSKRWPERYVQVSPLYLPPAVGTLPARFGVEFDLAFTALVNPSCTQRWIPSNLVSSIAGSVAEILEQTDEIPQRLEDAESSISLVVLKALGIEVELRVKHIRVDGATVMVVHGQPTAMPHLAEETVRRVHAAIAQWYATRPWDSILESRRLYLKAVGLACC